MNRSLLIFMVVLVAGGYLGTLIARDPGYVLIAYNGYSMQTSLWVMLGLILLVTLFVYLVLRSTGFMRRAPVRYRGWFGRRQAQRAVDLTSKGQRLLVEGEYKRAFKFLDSGALDNENRALNYLSAARAADKLGDGEARENYLRKAEEADCELSRARSVVAAELALERDEPEVALKLLRETKPNLHILQIKMKAIQAASNWSAGLAALPGIRKSDTALALEIEKVVGTRGLSDVTMSDSERHDLFRNFSAELRNDPDFIAQYVRGLEERDAVEPLLRATLKKLWNSELVVLYGELGEISLEVRRKVAENWQKTKHNDSALEYCLGRIYEQCGESLLARECYRRSIDLGGPVEAATRLAEIMADAGQYERSVALYRGILEGAGG